MTTKNILTAYLSIALLFLPYGAYAQGELSLNNALKEALNSNPEILAARRNYEAADARIWQAASLADPMVEFEYDKIYADRMLTGEPMKSYAISQDVPFPTKLFLRAKIAAKLAKMAYESYRSKEREIISETKDAYSELFRIHRSIEVTKENKGILEQFSKSANIRYQTAETNQADALKAQVELAKVENELIRLEQQRLTGQARINVLMNKDPGGEIAALLPEEPVEFTDTLDEMYVLAKNNNPELKVYRYAIERGKAAYDLSINELLPDISVKFKQLVERDRVNKRAWAGMLGVTIPLWFFQKQTFGIKEMKRELQMLKAEYKNKENMVLFDVRDAYARVEANIKIVQLYETAFIPQAIETTEAALRGYESNKTDFLTLLDSQRMLIEFKLDHYKAILEFRIALADLERSIGIDLKNDKEKGTNEKK